ncbi:unnamed protein product [Prorocentrum cordatum]|uniref:Uncharacterized protein n=1 Tax=Prorocentrum cordatum TaxID=2364126 RepID=A0ABN9P9Z7_9DINO|nr:unnamed protein product [Polarella glacialis]
MEFQEHPPWLRDAAVQVASTLGFKDEPSGQNFVDSAKELQDLAGGRRGQALLAKKGDDVDPQLKERLAGLEKQLEGLDLDGVAGGGANPELHEFLGGCIMMSMRKVGMRRPQTLAALSRLASGKLTQEEGASVELVRMTSVCVSELTDQELAQYKGGGLQVLPPALVAKAAESSAKDVVCPLEAAVWEQLAVVAAALQSQIVGDLPSKGLPQGTGLIAGIPLLAIFVFLGKKFYDMKQREVTKKDKKQKSKDR